MMMAKPLAALLVLALLVGCVQTSSTQLSRSEAMIHVDVPPACGPAGASQVAMQAAATTTLRQGFERFQMYDGQQYSDVSVVPQPLAPGGALVIRRHSMNLLVKMTNPGDAGYRDGLDARAILGDDWETRMNEDITSCR